jgi:hypothetical protein
MRGRLIIAGNLRSREVGDGNRGALGDGARRSKDPDVLVEQRGHVADIGIVTGSSLTLNVSLVSLVVTY